MRNGYGERCPGQGNSALKEVYHPVWSLPPSRPSVLELERRRKTLVAVIKTLGWTVLAWFAMFATAYCG